MTFVDTNFGRKASRVVLFVVVQVVYILYSVLSPSGRTNLFVAIVAGLVNATAIWLLSLLYLGTEFIIIQALGSYRESLSWGKALFWRGYVIIPGLLTILVAIVLIRWGNPWLGLSFIIGLFVLLYAAARIARWLGPRA